MIPRADIIAWRKVVPWQTNEQIEQDLVISRSLVEIFSDTTLSKFLAFRGGTALYKLHLKPAARYSEDIDLVQTEQGPIGPIFDLLREKLSFLGEPRVKQSQGNNTFIYRFDSEIPPVVQMRLKLEINCREHFNVFGLVKIPFRVESRWYNGECQVISYDLNELLGTKLRALYQRRKGRDLFDLWYASNSKAFQSDEVIHSFLQYMKNSHQTITQDQFMANILDKLDHRSFLMDIQSLILPEIAYDPAIAGKWCIENLISKIDEMSEMD